jgi:mannose-6-phosphate isomerase-like protein (cupin superfamily)
MSLVSGKVWGKTEQIWANSAFELHRLEIKAGTFCSEHRHKHKFNLFFVESGKLLIRSWKGDYELIDETELNAGDKFLQKPGEFHQFVCLEDCVCFEAYWAHFDHSDIERRTIGGKTP